MKLDKLKVIRISTKVLLFFNEFLKLLLFFNLFFFLQSSHYSLLGPPSDCSSSHSSSPISKRMSPRFVTHPWTPVLVFADLPKYFNNQRDPISIDFWGRVSCGPGWFWTYFIADDNFGLLILLPLPPKCWGYRYRPPPVGIKSRALYMKMSYSIKWTESPAHNLFSDIFLNKNITHRFGEMGDAQPSFWKTNGKLLARSKKCDVDHPIIGKQMSKLIKKTLLVTWTSPRALMQKAGVNPGMATWIRVCESVRNETKGWRTPGCVTKYWRGHEAHGRRRGFWVLTNALMG
jgi:hypothetical protein